MKNKPPTGLNGHAWTEMAEFNFGPDYLNSTIPLGALDPLELAERSDLLLYVLDGANGAQAADYRWVGRLRRLNVPLLVVLNKIDLITVNPEQRRAEIEARLAATVLPVSALSGANVAEQLFTTMITLCPKLTVALGRELVSFRRRAAHKLINRAALVNGLVALEPVPLLDLPVQVMTLTGLMLRLAAVYNRPADNVRRREMVLAVAGGLAGRYGAQQLAKLVPFVGWLASSLIACLCTWMLGRAAIAYFEGGG
ncbi:MAG: DUF697 domain-containing protein [Anaerolineales bacterium]|nr:DUF697 domain-containing protein [Anaerolineales bacterium]